MIKEIVGDLDQKVASINNALERVGIERHELSQLDHLAYRVETFDKYQEMKEALAAVALKLDETMVAGRPIAVFELHSYIQSGGWTIPYIELPAPKDGSPYKEGLEHAEFVVVGSLDQFQRNHPELPFITKALDRTLNPELGLKTDTAAIKFHEQPIGAVIRIEQRLAKS